MNINDAILSGPASTAPGMSAKDAERLQVLTLVQQFEGMLLTEMLRDVRAGDDEDQDGGSFGLGGSTMNDMMQSQLGAALSQAGGLGMGDLLAKALARQQDGGAPEVTPARLSPAALTGLGVSPGAAAMIERAAGAATNGAPVGAPTAGLAAPLALPGAAVTSAYGWRQDPLNGQRTFHQGTDLRMAYGSEVRAAAPGVVSSASERPGYGLTVVVDHGAGRETRYAHLSALDVAPGDQVGGGQLLARSGNSGRTTGPHLHFEAREYGRAVDPRVAAASWNGRITDTAVGESDESRLRY